MIAIATNDLQIIILNGRFNVPSVVDDVLVHKY